ncbi:MAG: adenylyltransferase/cytidyltransferase family protein [Verrucomicrobiota bacterium]|nr:adenylyltransferase/cytidyltransferase family protein [Verrucomicrobiota bacterium]
MPAWREAHQKAGRRVAVTNGCFDLLHAGHVTYLAAARAEADVLLVGLNGDASVRALKGEGRPLNPAADRATVLAALTAVDGVCVFEEIRATEFLKLAQPNVYVKGGDYTLEELDPEERAAVEAAGGVIRLLALVPGRSTSALVGKIAND